jgi:hypothetical protein
MVSAKVTKTPFVDLTGAGLKVLIPLGKTIKVSELIEIIDYGIEFLSK